MNTISPVFAIPAWHAHEHYSQLRERELVLAKDKNNREVELRIQEEQRQLDLPKVKMVEQVIEIEAGWFEPTTYTIDGKVNWGSRPLRTGLVIHEVV